jgi:hypothetical protein
MPLFLFSDLYSQNGKAIPDLRGSEVKKPFWENSSLTTGIPSVILVWQLQTKVQLTTEPLYFGGAFPVSGS